MEKRSLAYAEKYEAEILKLRKALEVADKALEHYGDDSNWTSGKGGTVRIYKVKSVYDKGFDVAQQARTEIQNILKEKS